MNNSLSFFVLSFLLLSLESKGMVVQQEKPRLLRVQSRYFTAIDTQEPLKQDVRKIDGASKNQKEHKQNIPTGKRQEQSFTDYTKNSQKQRLFLMDISSKTQTVIGENECGIEIDDEGLPIDDGSDVLDKYLFQDNEHHKEETNDFKRVSERRRQTLPQKSLVVSGSRKQRKSQQKLNQPRKRKQDFDSKHPPKRQKVSQKPKPVQNPQKKPQGQPPTS